VIIRRVGLAIREKRKELLIQFSHAKHKLISSWKSIDVFDMRNGRG